MEWGVRERKRERGRESVGKVERERGEFLSLSFFSRKRRKKFGRHALQNSAFSLFPFC
jgi:hypothetical protein